MGNGNKTNERIQANFKNPIIDTIVFLDIQQWQVQLGRASLNPSDSKWGDFILNFQDLRPSCMDDHLCSSKFLIADKWMEQYFRDILHSSAQVS